jgi:hypothetical protein
MWEEMEKQGIDIHKMLSNGINHPTADFHERMAEALEQKLFADAPVAAQS